MPTLIPSPPKVLKIENPGGIPQKETAVPSFSPPGGTPQQETPPAARIAPPGGTRQASSAGTTTGAPRGSAVAAEKIKDAQEKGKAGKAAPTPYNALNPPYENKGELEQQVQRIAKAEYMPELNNLAEEKKSQEGLTKQREADNTNIYNQYMKSAEESLANARSIQAEIAARMGGSNAAGMTALSQAVGNTDVANPQDYTGASVGTGAANSTELAAIQNAILGQSSQNLLIPGANRAEAGYQEAQRSEGIQAKLSEQQQKAVGRIPDITAKVRAEIQKEEDARENLRIQREIADKKLGLEGKKVKETAKENERKLGITEKQGEKKLGLEGEKIKLAEVQGNKKLQIAAETLMQKSKLENRKISATEAIKLAEIQVKKEAIQATATLNKEKVQQEALKIEAERGKAEGTRAVNAIKIMEEYLALGKSEEPPGVTPEVAKAKGKVPYTARTPEALYRKLTIEGGLEPTSAYRLMTSSNEPKINTWAEEKLAESAVPGLYKHTKF